VLITLVLAVAAGIGAVVGAATVTARPALFLIAGLVGFCATNAAGIALAFRSLGGDHRRATGIATFVVTTVAIVGVFVVTALRPPHGPWIGAAPVRGQHYWDLSTGSRIAYVRLPGQGTPRSTPVIVLQRGPGVSDLAGYARYFRQLTATGFTVYVYDQVGSGHSSRLDDPHHYGLGRDVADLEAIRTAIGAPRVDLVGDSYGSLLAAAYQAQHGSHVTRTVLASPADLSPTKFSKSTIGRLDNSQLRGLTVAFARPRTMLAYALLQVNPNAAHNFAGDGEMDARFDVVYRKSEPAQQCKRAKLGPALHGLGFYANEYPQSGSSPKHPDYRPALRKDQAPALVIKGSCDYESWSSGTEYVTTLPHAQLVYLPGAGNDVYADQPAKAMQLISSFLAGQPLPIEPYAGTKKPADYQGPR